MTKITTDDFWGRLQEIDLTQSSIFLHECISGFDPQRFLQLASAENSKWKIIPSTDGPISIVKEAGSRADLSRSSADFDFHIDGAYLNPPPHLVILSCVNPGLGNGTTLFTDGLKAVSSIEESEIRTTLENSSLCYISSKGTVHTHDPISLHPRTKEPMTIIGSRTFLRQSENKPLGILPSLRQIQAASAELLNRLDTSIFHEHQWQEGSTVVFDNYRYPHGRRSAGPDPDRMLYRLWLSPK